VQQCTICHFYCGTTIICTLPICSLPLERYLFRRCANYCVNSSPVPAWTVWLQALVGVDVQSEWLINFYLNCGTSGAGRCWLPLQVTDEALPKMGVSLVLSDWCLWPVTPRFLLQLDVGLAVLLDVGVGFSPPVGVLRHFVQSEVVNQEGGVGFRTHDDDLSVASFCNTHITVISGCCCCCCCRNAAFVSLLSQCSSKRPRSKHTTSDYLVFDTKD